MQDHLAGQVKPYEQDWSDRSRDLANLFFLVGYLTLMLDHTKAGAGVYLVAECFLVPHSIRCRSWSTIAVSLVFAAASVVRLLQ